MEKCPKLGQIEGEVNILKELQDVEGIPNLIHYGMTPENKYLVFN